MKNTKVLEHHAVGTGGIELIQETLSDGSFVYNVDVFNIVNGWHAETLTLECSSKQSAMKIYDVLTEKHLITNIA